MLIPTPDKVDGLVMNERRLTIQISSSSGAGRLSLEFLAPIPASELTNVSISMVHHNAYTNIHTLNTNKARIIHISDSKIEKYSNQLPHLVKVSLESKDQYAILSHLLDNAYSMNYILESYALKLVNQSSDIHTLMRGTVFNDLSLKNWGSNLQGEPQNNFKLSMEPPSIGNSSLTKVSDTIDDPFDYFIDKYFGTLYQLTTPLTFFTKSTFSRLKTLCLNTSSDYEATLRQFIITLDNFDSRHMVSNNGLLNSQNMFEMESVHRGNFVSKSLNLVDLDVHSTNFLETNKSISNILNTFKIREIQMQLIILLELISYTENDNLKQLNKTVKAKRKTTSRLIGRRKLTPVINGGAIVTEARDTYKPSELSYIEKYDSFVDRLLIWETLNSSSSSFSSSVFSSSSPASTTLTSDYSSTKFITNVIIPYFDKKCPNSVKHMIKKIKGPSFRSQKTKKKAGLRRSVSEVSSTATSQDGEKKLSRLGDLSDIRLPRSNSDLQQITRNSSFNATNLSRRQVDVSVPVAQTTTHVAIPKLNRTTSVFNRVGKRTVSLLAEQRDDRAGTGPISQVNETPVKKQKYINIMETPQAVQISEINSVVRSTHEPKSINSEMTVHSSVKSLPMMDEIMSSVPRPDNQKVAPAPTVGLESPLAIRSTAKMPKPGDPFEFESLSPQQIRMSSTKVKRKLFQSVTK